MEAVTLYRHFLSVPSSCMSFKSKWRIWGRKSRITRRTMWIQRRGWWVTVDWRKTRCVNVVLPIVSFNRQAVAPLWQWDKLKLFCQVRRSRVSSAVAASHVEWRNLPLRNTVWSITQASLRTTILSVSRCILSLWSFSFLFEQADHTG